MDVESIYTTLKSIINKENIIEVSFVPTQGEGEYKPFYFIENCIGIPFPIVPKTLEFLKKKFVNLRKNIELNYKEIDNCTQCILLINGEYITAWNERKKLIKLNYIEPKYDLLFTKLCLTKHPKSSNLWYHRQWILKNYQELIHFETEFEIIEKAINRYATNYFAWNHRIWLLDYMDKIELKEELKKMQNKMYKYISDHAGWNYLLNILKKIVLNTEDSGERKELPKFFNEHIQFVRKNMKEFPGHETIWYYLRLLIAFIEHYKDIIYNDDVEGQNLQSLFDDEMAFIHHYLTDSNTLCMEEKCALQYQLWLYTVFKNKITKADYSNLYTSINDYQIFTDDLSTNYLMEIINHNKND